MKTLAKINFKFLIGSLVIFSFVTVWYSCSDEVLDQFLTFDYSDSTSFTAPIIKGQRDTTITFSTSAKEELEKNGTSMDLIKKATLKALSLTITAPSGKTFTFLDSISIFIDATTLSKNLLASKTLTSADKNSNILILDTKSSDFVPYIKQDSISMQYSLLINQTLGTIYTFGVSYTFSITADPLK